MYAYIFNLQRFSIHDGPGIRTTVFFQGCPLQCIWCHNPEGIPSHLDRPGNGSFQGSIKIYTIESLLEEILKDKAFFEESGGGVTFSGGEPLMQSEFLIKILKKLRSIGIHTAIDTSGYAPSNIFKEVVALTDLVLFDLKIIDNKKHRTYTGIDNSQIHKNLNYLIENKTPFRVRIPLVNNITADNKNLEKIKQLLKGDAKVDIDLLSYHDLGKGKREKMGMKTPAKALSAPSPHRLKEIHKLFDPASFNINMGG
ncbi:MAG TPA: glycyl-radical enzyme activating protein [Bacteroidales bacterium]|nr:glycyl-radical enzyme activating protein [Bacteroidales bacterium]